MTTPPHWHVHTRALLLLDELHRVGFEQLRFARSLEGQYLRLQLYPAQHGERHDWLILGDGPHLTFSYAVLYLHLPQVKQEHGETDRSADLAQKWMDLLSGPTKPQHLAGEFILDFPELLRPAYGPDHDYRQWFRQIRPHLHQGRLPLTFDEDSLNYGDGWDPKTHSCVVAQDGNAVLLPAPPTNLFLRASR